MVIFTSGFEAFSREVSKYVFNVCGLVGGTKPHKI